MERADLIALAKSTATAHQLFPDIVCAICEKESSWNQWAYRYEPVFYSRYVEPEFDAGKITVTEAHGRATSWGLMQTIGESVREIGYLDWLPALCEPATGIEWGCLLFTHKLGHAGGNYAAALSLWNGGGDSSYSPSVLEIAKKYQ
jgi:soluble lytic murein transglycosylase-like protein